LSKGFCGKRLAFLPVLIILCFCSCASITSDKRPYAYLTDRAKFELLPPWGIEKPMDMVQYVSASYGGRDFFSNAFVRADETGMDIVLLNELGASMGEISYRGNAVNFSSSVFPASLKPEYIVADFQFCFYDSLLLQQALKGSGLVLEIEGTTRRIRDGKKLIVEIEKASDSVRFVNHLRGYAYSLEGDFEGNMK